MRKIIFVTKALWIGGIETALINLLKNIDYTQYDVTLLLIHAELDLLDQIPSNCKVLIIDREKNYTFKDKYKYDYLYHMTEEPDNPSHLHAKLMWTVPIIKWVENELYIHYVYKLMHNQHFDTAVIYSDVVAETTIRAIKADKYIMFYHHGAMRHVYHDKIAYKKCDKIIAVSENQANELKKFMPKAVDKIMVIHNLIDIDGIRCKANQPIKENFDRTKFNIVSVGRVAHEKGMDMAVRVCAELVAEGVDNIRWWIVGDGPDMLEVQDVISETHMGNYIFTVGMKTNPYPYIRQADLYVQPSRIESFGLTITEALILDKTVVSTETFGATEILSKKSNCTMCKVGVESLVNAIKKYLSCPELLQQRKDFLKQFKKQNENSMYMLEKIL